MRTLAFPSWLMAGSIVQNVHFLIEKWPTIYYESKLPQFFYDRPEVGLCFFESKACLAYTSRDLPSSLAPLPLSWHLHLPLDLPWPDIRACVDICLELLKKVEHLNIQHAVLHPFTNSSDKRLDCDGLFNFFELWKTTGKKPDFLLLENLPGSNLNELLALSCKTGCGFCLDLAHLYMEQQLEKVDLPVNYLDKVKLVHINAPGTAKVPCGHASLDTLSPNLFSSYCQILAQLPAKAIFMLELFDQKKIIKSIPLLHKLLATN